MTTSIKVQTLGDNLRLPCYSQPFPSSVNNLISSLGELVPKCIPIPFQSKHLSALKRNSWFVLQRPPDRSRTGMLVIWPDEKCSVYISTEKQTPRVILLRLRLDPQMIADGGMTVFAATLTPHQRRLWIEDTLVWKGRTICHDESFSTRFARAGQWLEHFCVADPTLLNGVTVELAQWSSLQSLRPEGSWNLINDCVGSRKLVWISNTRTQPVQAPVQIPVQALMQIPVQEVVQQQYCIATRDSKPEQWTLTSLTNIPFGKALVRTLAVADVMRTIPANLTTVKVNVQWNQSFSKWEILHLVE